MIEIPDPARNAAAGWPDACTTCHVEADRTWAAAQAARLWPGRFAGTAVPDGDHGAPKDALFAGDPGARGRGAGPRAAAGWRQQGGRGAAGARPPDTGGGGA